MKKTIFSIVALTAMGIGTASAVDFTSVDNLAAGCAVEVSSERNDGDRNRITDDDLGTSWQAKEIAGGEQRTFQDWFIVDLGETKEFTDIEVTWQAAHPYLYDIYVTDEKPEFTTDAESTTKDQTITADWLAANTPAVVDAGCGNYGDATSPETITSSGTFRGRYIMVYAKNYATWAIQYGICCYELRVADLSEVANQISSLQFSDVSVAKGSTVEVTVSAKTMAGEAVDLNRFDSITLTCSDAEAVTITDVEKGKFSVTGNKFGYYTMTATAVGEGSTFEATANLVVAYDWATVTNIAQGKSAYSNYNNANAYKSVDGDFGSRWEAGGDVRSGVKYYVDLATEYNITAVGFNWDAAYCNQYKLYYASDGVGISGEDGVNNEAWVEFLSVDRVLANANKNTDTNVLDTPVKARYVMIESVETQIWGMSFYEMLIAGELAEEIDPTKITSIKIADATIAEGEIATISVAAYNKLGKVIADAEMTTTLTADSDKVVITKNEDGTYSVTCAEMGVYTLTALATVGEETFTATATLTVLINWTNTENIADATVNTLAVSYASHNSENANQSNDGNTGTRWEAGSGATGDSAWWYIDLGNEYNVSAIEFVWEGAYAKKYEVLYATTLQEAVEGEAQEPLWAETPLFTQEKELQGFPNTDTHVFDAVKARYIKVHQLEEGFGGYGMSMWEVRIAGTPASEAVLTSLSLTADQTALFAGEPATLTLKAIDNYGKAYPTADAVITLEENTSDAVLEGMTLTTAKKGAVTVKATLGNLEAAVCVATVAEGENVALASTGSVATACEESENPQNAIDGDAGSLWVAPYDEAVGQDDNHWIMVDLAGYYDVDMVEISWEGAIAANYNIEFSVDGENFGDAPAYTHVGKDGVSAETHRFYGVEATGVRYVKVNVTRHASTYGSKIYELRVYGVGEKLMEANEEGTEFSGAWNETTFAEKANFAAPEIDLTNVRALPAEIVLPEDANKHLFIYVPAGAACANQANVIVKNEDFSYTANQINLYDGVDYYITHSVDVVNVTFNKEFKTADVYDSFVVPFAFTPSADLVAYEFVGVNEENNIYLSEAKATVEANIPMVVEVKADVTSVSAQNVTLYPDPSTLSSVVEKAPADLDQVIAHFTYESKATEGTEFTVQGTTVAAFEGTLTAFDVYFDIPVAGSSFVYTIRANVWVGISSTLFDDPNALVDVYNLNGVRVRTAVKASEAGLDLDRGVYIIGGKKVMVK